MVKSKGQRMVILGGLIIFLLMGFYPPWREVLNYGQGQIITQGVSYSSIFNPTETGEAPTRMAFFFPTQWVNEWSGQRVPSIARCAGVAERSGAEVISAAAG